MLGYGGNRLNIGQQGFPGVGLQVDAVANPGGAFGPRDGVNDRRQVVTPAGDMDGWGWLGRRCRRVIGFADGIDVLGLHVVLARAGVYFFADTTVNIDPSAEDLAEIACVTADAVKFFTDEAPRVAMLSFSNFGSSRHEKSDRVRHAVKLVRRRKPDLVIDGEMRIDTALNPEFSKDVYPFNAVAGDANVLIFPDLDSGNLAYKLMMTLGGAEVIGPILLGIDAPVNVIIRGSTVTEIVNLAAVTVVRAQER